MTFVMFHYNYILRQFLFFLYNYTQTKKAHMKSLSIKIMFEKSNIYTQVYEYNTTV